MSNSKTIVITGASSGIGLAASRQLAASGAHVVMISRDPARGVAARLGELSAMEAIR
jgi:NAD(P)-dependent dehydrogenase (short-subunit alcohol dehydrogenase family)